MKQVVAIVLGVLMVAAGINHVWNPDFYTAIMPPFLNPTLVHVVALILEVTVGILLILP
jgi:uncharacterized membrane protein